MSPNFGFPCGLTSDDFSSDAQTLVGEGQVEPCLTKGGSGPQEMFIFENQNMFSLRLPSSSLPYWEGKVLGLSFLLPCLLFECHLVKVASGIWRYISQGAISMALGLLPERSRTRSLRFHYSISYIHSYKCSCYSCSRLYGEEVPFTPVWALNVNL